MSRIKTFYELTNVNAYYRHKESLEPNLSAESLELDQNTSQFIAKRLSPRIGTLPLFIFPTIEGNLEKQNSSLSLKAGKKVQSDGLEASTPNGKQAETSKLKWRLWAILKENLSFTFLYLQ